MLNIQKYRKSKKMKQTELAKATGIKCSTLSQYETGKREPSIEALKNIANVLDCSIDDLIKNKEK